MLYSHLCSGQGSGHKEECPTWSRAVGRSSGVEQPDGGENMVISYICLIVGAETVEDTFRLHLRRDEFCEEDLATLGSVVHTSYIIVDPPSRRLVGLFLRLEGRRTRALWELRWRPRGRVT